MKLFRKLYHEVDWECITRNHFLTTEDNHTYVNENLAIAIAAEVSEHMTDAGFEPNDIVGCADGTIRVMYYADKITIIFEKRDGCVEVMEKYYASGWDREGTRFAISNSMFISEREEYYKLLIERVKRQIKGNGEPVYDWLQLPEKS
jgi:hypothetical protein